MKHFFLFQIFDALNSNTKKLHRVKLRLKEKPEVKIYVQTNKNKWFIAALKMPPENTGK